MKYFVTRPDNLLNLKSGTHYFLNKRAPLVEEMVKCGDLIPSSEVQSGVIAQSRSLSQIVATRKSRKQAKKKQTNP